MAERNVRRTWAEMPDVWKKAVYKLKDLIVELGETVALDEARDAWRCALRFARQDAEKEGLPPGEPIPPKAARVPTAAADAAESEGELEPSPF